MPNQFAAAAVIYARDMLRISKFYEAIASLVVTEAEAGHVVLEANGFQLSVVAIPAHIAASVEIAEPPVRREGSPIKLIYFVASIAAAREQVAKLGGQLNSVTYEWQFQGTRVCDGHDPEGNVFQLRENSF